MIQSVDKSKISRREFLKQGGSLASAAAVLGRLAPAAFAGEDHTIRLALIEKIRSGAMGEIPLIRANRLGSGGWLKNQGDRANSLMDQLQFGKIHLFWVGSGHMVDNLIHQIDECCWIIEKDNIAWTPAEDLYSPWQYEWNVFIDSIRNDRPHNELRRAVYSDLTSLMGRAACHTGQIVTWDQIMESKFQFCGYLDELSFDSPAPVKADQNGQFPVPVPGQWKEV